MATMNIFTGTFKKAQMTEQCHTLNHFTAEVNLFIFPSAGHDLKSSPILSHKHYTFDPDG